MIPRIDRPITVLASYRTGSTALCDWLARNFKYTNFDETFRPAAPHRESKFLLFRRLFRDRLHWVVKIMGDQICDRNQQVIDSVIKQSFVIRLARKDIVSQIASYYVSSLKQVWHYQNQDYQEPYTIDIDHNRIESMTRYIIKVNNIVKNLSYPIDLDLWYEDLGVMDSNYVRYNRPSNYDQLLIAVQNFYETSHAKRL